MSIPAQRLRQRLAADGPVTFAEFMAEALYGEGGYYRRPGSPIGPRGDYVTGASLSRLFGQTTARLVERLDQVLGRPVDVLEVGYGDGHHLTSLQVALRAGPARSIRGLDRASRPLPEGLEILESLDDLQPESVQGLVFSYELFDALPVHRLIADPAGEVRELWVGLDAAGEFCYQEGELSDPRLLECLGDPAVRLEAGQIVDVTPEWDRIYGRLAGCLARGLLVTCDYGFERRQLFDRRVRFHGTVACYSRQRVHRDALRAVGEQDLSAHVDFTTLRNRGEALGLQTFAFTRQARWLTACGLFDLLEGAEPSIRIEAMDLLDPAGMGEEIRVLVQGRDIDVAPLLDLHLL